VNDHLGFNGNMSDNSLVDSNNSSQVSCDMSGGSLDVLGDMFR